MAKQLEVITAVLVAFLVGTAFGKIARAKPIVENLESSEVSHPRFNQLAVLEMVGAVGLVLGLMWRTLGILSGIWVMVYFAGAVTAHIKAGDKNVLPAGSCAVLAGAVAVMHAMRPGTTGDRPL